MTNLFKYTDTQSLDKKIKSGEFPFSQNLFWDSSIENIDLQKNQRYVIERVLMRGFTSDFYVLNKIYSASEIQDALRKTKELDAKTAQFCSKYYNMPLSEIHVSSFYR